MRRQELTGQQFERLLVISEAGRDKWGKLVWLCRCICGVEKVVSGSALKTGNTKSCGCLNRQLASERLTTHGEGKTPAYCSYKSAKKRCENSNSQKYALYGGRGIKFLFDNYEEFIAHIGPRPSKKYSLDRINNDGNYEPGNVRWATKETQSRNTRSNRWLIYKNQRLCVADWAKKLGLVPSAINSRLDRGWSIEKALSTPARSGKGK